MEHITAKTQTVQCQSCRYYDTHRVNGGQATGEEGVCRFNPPVSQTGPQDHGL